MANDTAKHLLTFPRVCLYWNIFPTFPCVTLTSSTEYCKQEAPEPHLCCARECRLTNKQPNEYDKAIAGITDLGNQCWYLDKGGPKVAVAALTSISSLQRFLVLAPPSSFVGHRGPLGPSYVVLGSSCSPGMELDLTDMFRAHCRKTSCAGICFLPFADRKYKQKNISWPT